jgi:hypothetical protein
MSEISDTKLRKYDRRVHICIYIVLEVIHPYITLTQAFLPLCTLGVRVDNSYKCDQKTAEINAKERQASVAVAVSTFAKRCFKILVNSSTSYCT